QPRPASAGAGRAPPRRTTTGCGQADCTGVPPSFPQASPQVLMRFGIAASPDSNGPVSSGQAERASSWLSNVTSMPGPYNDSDALIVMNGSPRGASMQLGIAYGRKNLTVEVAGSDLVSVRRQPVTPPLPDPAAAVRQALEMPLGFPALRRALTPDDHVVL